ncbi:Eisosome component PIL1-domain-containing protein, partial [Jimgerdemannia flammicorona]
MRIQNLQKTSPRSTKLKEFQHELVALDHETQEQETELADFKRFALREAFYIQFNALFEVAEKTAILAGFGRYIIDEIDVTPTVMGGKRPEYKGGRQTAQVLADALEAVNGWHAPELDERPTLTQKVGAEAFYQQDNDSGENMALSRHPSTRMAQLQHDAAEHAVSADDVDVGIGASSRSAHSRERLASVTSQDSQDSDGMSLYASMPSPPLTRERLASQDSVESDTTSLYTSLPSPPLTRDNLTSDSSSPNFTLYPSTPSPPVSRQTMFMTPQDSVASLASSPPLPFRQSTRESVASPPERQESVVSPPERQESVASPPERQESVVSPPERQESVASPP